MITRHRSGSTKHVKLKVCVDSELQVVRLWSDQIATKCVHYSIGDVVDTKLRFLQEKRSLLHSVDEQYHFQSANSRSRRTLRSDRVCAVTTRRTEARREYRGSHGRASAIRIMQIAKEYDSISPINVVAALNLRVSSLFGLSRRLEPWSTSPPSPSSWACTASTFPV